MRTRGLRQLCGQAGGVQIRPTRSRAPAVFATRDPDHLAAGRAAMPTGAARLLDARVRAADREARRVLAGPHVDRRAHRRLGRASLRTILAAAEARARGPRSLLRARALPALSRAALRRGA